MLPSTTLVKNTAHLKLHTLQTKVTTHTRMKRQGKKKTNYFTLFTYYLHITYLHITQDSIYKII